MWPFYVAHIKVCEIEKDLDESLRLKKISRMGHDLMKREEKEKKSKMRAIIIHHCIMVHLITIDVD